MVKVHDQSLIHAATAGVKLQMVSVEVKAAWESHAGRVADTSHSFQLPWVQILCRDGSCSVLGGGSQPF